MMNNNRSVLIIGISIVVIGTLIWVSLNMKKDVNIDGKVDVRVQLQWFHGAQFMGMYVAKEKGYFLDEGLNVILKPIAGYTSDPIAILANKEADIAIAPADQILINKDRGRQIKAFGTPFNRSLACYSYKVEAYSNSEGINIFKNSKIGVYKKFDTENILLAIDKKHNLDLNLSNIVQAPSLALEAFKNNEIDILGSYFINEPIKLNLDDVNVKCLDPYDYGVEFYGDTYIADQEIWSGNNTNEGEPKLKKEHLEKFLRASAKGWLYAKQFPKESLDIMFSQITNKTRGENYVEEEMALFKAVSFIGDGPDSRPGYMNKDKWVNMEQELYKIGRISQTGFIDELVDFSIIDEAYEKE